jgi:hypothetical protein
MFITKGLRRVRVRNPGTLTSVPDGLARCRGRAGWLRWLNERIASGPADIAAEAAGLVIMTAGVYALAHRSPQRATYT